MPKKKPDPKKRTTKLHKLEHRDLTLRAFGRKTNFVDRKKQADRRRCREDKDDE